MIRFHANSRHLHQTLLVGALLLVLQPLVDVHAEEPAPNSTDRNIAELILLLGSDDFDTRERATRELIKVGEAARETLEKAIIVSKDDELLARSRNILKQLDRVQLTATEMHVVGINQPQRQFHLLMPHGKGIKWKKLCSRIQRDAEADVASPGQRLWRLLDRRSQLIVASPEQAALIDEWVAHSHIDEFQRLPRKHNIAGMDACVRLSRSLGEALRRRDFYEENAFSDVTLTKDVKKQLAQRKELSILELWILNRRLFESAFPDEVEGIHFDIDEATVHVHVRNAGKPINVVLCSYHPVQWIVKKDEGADLKNIIIGGYYPQLVSATGTKVHKFVREESNSSGGQPYFYAYQRGTHYTRMAQFLRDLTGMEITTFHGEYAVSDNKSIVVGNSLQGDQSDEE